MKRLCASVLTSAIVLSSQMSWAADTDLAALEQAAKKEGEVNSVGMPDSWANWKGTWQDLLSKYGLKHVDTDMSSAQEIAKFDAEKNNATADIGDVGAAFGPVAVQKGVTQPYKPSTWDQVPDWAKDKDGHWALAYTGTIAFIINKQQVKDIPHSWADLLKGSYQVSCPSGLPALPGSCRRVCRALPYRCPCMLRRRAKCPGLREGIFRSQK